MKFCSQCGEQMPDEARFCNACGAAAMEPEILSAVPAAVESRETGLGTGPDLSLQPGIPPVSVKPQGKGSPGVRKGTIIAGIVIALLLVAGGFWGWRSLGSEARVQQKLDMAVKYLSDGKFEEAILAYNDAIKIEPKEVKAYQGLARVYTLQGKYDEAKATYDRGAAAVAQDKQQTLQLGLAGMYIDQGQLANAEKAFQEIKNGNKTCLEAYWGLAMVYQKQGDNAKAEAILRQAVDQNPNEYRAYNTLALFLRQNNKADEAFNNLVKSLALEINQQEAYLVLNDLYKGRWPQLQAKPSTVSNQRVSVMLEFYSYYAAGDYQKAVNSYKEKLSQQTDNQKARVLAAVAMFKTGDKAGAETLLNQLNKEKLNEWLLSDLAYYYQAAGDKEKAREYAVKALQANGTNLDAIALLQTLNSEDASIKIYTAQALLYNWKPIGKVKEELQARSLLRMGIDYSAVGKADPNNAGKGESINEDSKVKVDNAEEDKTKNQITDQVSMDRLLIEAVEKGDSASVKNLLAMGANVNAKDQYTSNALSRACIWGHEDIAELLLENGANVFNRDKWGTTPLMDAALRGRSKAAKLIIARGADVNARDNRGYTALMKTAFVGNPSNEHPGCLEVARSLLEAGADFSIKNQYGETALSMAKLAGPEDMVSLLKSYGAKD